MSIIDFLTTTISGIGSPSPTFIYGVKSWQNLIADNETLPVIFLDEPIHSDDEIKQSGYINEVYKLTFLFLDKTEMDYTPAQHEVVVKAMRELRREFLLALYNDESVKELRNIGTDNIFNIFDCQLSGCMLTIQLSIYSTDSVC